MGLKFPEHYCSLDSQRTADMELVVGASDGFALSEMRVMVDSQGLRGREVLNAAGSLSSVVVSSMADKRILVGIEIEHA